MADPKDKNSVQYWRDKYVERAEAFDAREKALQEDIHLLQRVLVRVSLAAEGVDPKLDHELGQLRDILRRENGGAQKLAESLENLEKTVLKLDERKEVSAGQVLGSLQDLVEQLLARDLPKAQAKELKKFSTQLKEQRVSLQDYPNLLERYARMQSEALAGLFQEASGGAGGEGFLSRLFGRRGGASVEPAPVADREPEMPDREDESWSESDTELATGPHVSEPPHLTAEPAGGEQLSAVAQHVVSTLSHLLEQLPLPEPAKPDADRIRQSLDLGLNWYELGPTFDDVAGIVISAVGKGQKDFEEFLHSLDERLARIQQFLAGSQEHTQSRNAGTQHLDRMVREQLTALGREANAARDLEGLKSQVKSHVDLISEAMTEFITLEDQREQELNRQIEQLQSRLVSLEGETKVIRERLKEERQRALTDVLTSLPNREAWQERVAMEYDRWRRYRQPITLAVADIDHFKRINDQYGHLAGDKVIQIMAKEISRRIRTTDFVARYGGEEFVVLMPETPVTVAREVMDKTRSMIERLPFHFRNERVQVTMSFGLCEFREGLSTDQIFELADKALYAAKQAGRNRVMIAPE